MVLISNKFFVVGLEDGIFVYYLFEINMFDCFLIWISFLVCDVVFFLDDKWCVVVSDEFMVKLVNMEDIMNLFMLKEYGE